MKRKLFEMRPPSGISPDDGFSYNIRGKPGSGHSERLGKAPDWALDDSKLGKLLLQAFPKMRTNPTQRKRAARWALIIRLYFRVGWTGGQVASQLLDWAGIMYPSKSQIKDEIKRTEDTLTRIRRAASGLRTTGKQRTQNRGGRPKKPRTGLYAIYAPLKKIVL